MPGPDCSRVSSQHTRLVPRGVYVQPFVGSSGERIVVGVDRHGRRLIEATIYDYDGRDAIVDLVWRALDKADPPPLRVIR